MNMKRLSLILALTPMLAFAATEPSDLVHGVDLTARTSVSGALLNQLVDLSTPSTNKGFVIRQATEPDTVSNPRYTNYLWIKSDSQIVYAWNGSAWVTAANGTNTIGTDSITNNAVTGAKIAGRTIHATNLIAATLTEAEIAGGAITVAKMGPASVGYAQLIAGSVDGVKLTNGAVLSTNIADLNVTSNKIAAACISTDKLADGAVTWRKTRERWAIVTYGVATPVIQSGEFASAGWSGPWGGTCAINFTAPFNNVNYFVSITPEWAGIAGYPSNMFSTVISKTVGQLVINTGAYINGPAVTNSCPANLYIRCFDYAP